MSNKLNKILTEYYPKIFKTCFGYTRTLEDANDLTQEVLIRIWKGYASFKGDSTLNTWIYRITVNSCLMFIRKNKKQVLVDINTLNHLHHENQNIDQEEIDELYKHIAQLNEKDRLVIILYLEELTYDEIADIIGISTNYVGVKINRIKKILSAKIKNV
ncbi:MAG: RNA polymerase sigma factor [Flavobacteriaceae bacterium]